MDKKISFVTLCHVKRQFFILKRHFKDTDSSINKLIKINKVVNTSCIYIIGFYFCPSIGNLRKNCGDSKDWIHVKIEKEKIYNLHYGMD